MKQLTELAKNIELQASVTAWTRSMCTPGWLEAIAHESAPSVLLNIEMPNRERRPIDSHGKLYHGMGSLLGTTCMRRNTLSAATRRALVVVGLVAGALLDST
jgi:hypothetical protein